MIQALITLVIVVIAIILICGNDIAQQAHGMTYDEYMKERDQNKNK